MSEEQAVTTGDDNPFSSPEAFHASLAKLSEPAPEPETKEAPIEEAAEEEEQAEEQVDGEEEEDYSKPVPPRRLKKEIEKRKEFERNYQQERDDRIKAQRDLENLNATIQKYMKPEQEEAATGDDEIDALDPETTNKLLKRIAALETQLTTKDQKDTQKEAQSYFASSLDQHQRDFEKATPDFKESYQFLLQSTYNEYIASGYDDATAKNETMKSLQKKAAVAFQNGKNTAAVAYELAKARGYAPKGKVVVQKMGPDLGKIAENMGKSASLAEVAEASTGGSGYDGTAETLSKFARKEGGFIDGKKFAQLLKQQEQNY